MQIIWRAWLFELWTRKRDNHYSGIRYNIVGVVSSYCFLAKHFYLDNYETGSYTVYKTILLPCPPFGNSCSLHMYAGRPDNQVETHMPDLETTWWQYQSHKALWKLPLSLIGYRCTVNIIIVTTCFKQLFH